MFTKEFIYVPCLLDFHCKLIIVNLFSACFIFNNLRGEFVEYGNQQHATDAVHSL